MKKYTVIFVLISVCLSQIVSAQNNDKNFDIGSAALLFQFSGFSNLGAGSYMGGIGGKYFLSPTMAARGGLQFAHYKDKNPYNPPANVTPIPTGKDGEESATVLGVAGAIEIHANAKRVSPYLGAGAAFQTASSEEKNIVQDPTPQTTIKNDNGYTQLEFFILLGAEFFLYKQLISLSAEYQAGYSSTSYKDRKTTTGSTTVTIKQGSERGLGIVTSGMLTLAVYL